jgi:hypothetical protein
MPVSIVFRVHALQRMFERRITAEDVRSILETGETIERYADDAPYPSRLVLGWRDVRPFHVVVAENLEGNELIVISVYQPDPALWEPGFTRRKP